LIVAKNIFEISNDRAWIAVAGLVGQCGQLVSIVMMTAKSMQVYRHGNKNILYLE
jgi:hypothetical protein